MKYGLYSFIYRHRHDILAIPVIGRTAVGIRSKTSQIKMYQRNEHGVNMLTLTHFTRQKSKSAK